MRVLFLHDDLISHSVRVFMHDLRRQGIEVHSTCDPNLNIEKIEPDLVLWLSHARGWKSAVQSLQNKVPCARLMDWGLPVLPTEQEEENPYAVIPADMNVDDAAWMMKWLAQLQKRNFTLQKQVMDLKERLATRIKIDQAKGILMNRLGFSEAEAFGYIRRTAMNQRKNMKEVSQTIIHSN